MILEAHEERAGHEGRSRLGLDDLQCRTYGVGRGVDGSGNETVCFTEHHEHGAKVAVIGELLACLFLGHALLGTQLAQFGDHRSEYFLVVLGLELRLFKGFESKLLTAGENAFLVSDDDQIDDITLEQIVGCLDDAVFGSFRKHDGSLVCLGLAQQAVLECVWRGRSLERSLDSGNKLFCVDIRLECFRGLGHGVFLVEINGG